MSKPMLIGAVLVLLALIALVVMSSAHVRKLKADGQFGQDVVVS